MKELIYWIKFDKAREPIKIIAKDFLELQEMIHRQVAYHQESFEWLIRDYK